ncbi:hypothetical protein MP638_002865 [Amoeboaphelidium occidentale]|nr:hypothetical protein MP638_002865 [Amoeboaphelidium occidentale]
MLKDYPQKLQKQKDLSTSGVVGEYKVKIYKEEGQGEGGDTANPNPNHDTSKGGDTTTTSNPNHDTSNDDTTTNPNNPTSNDDTTTNPNNPTSMKDTTTKSNPKTVAALVTYYRVESVQLALDLLDGSVLKYKDGNNYELKVSRADYSKSSNSCKDKDTTTTDSINNNQSKRRMTKAELKKQVQFIQRQLDWNDHNPQKNKKNKKSCLILKNLFSVKDLEKNPELLLEIKEDVLQECEKYGKVTKVDVQESLVYVRFHDHDSNSNDDGSKVIEECIKVFNGRYFDGRIVEATSGDYDQVKSTSCSSLSSSSSVLMVDEDLEEESRLKRYSDVLKYKDGNNYELKVSRADYSKSSNSCKDKDTTTTDSINNNQSKRRMTKAELKKQVQFIQRQLDWNDHNPQKNKKNKKSCLILKNLFSVKDLEKNPELLLEIKEDVLQECEKYGKVTKVDVQESLVYVRFHDHDSNSNDDGSKVIEECIKVFNGRYFDGRIVEATSGDYDQVKSTSCSSLSSSSSVLMVDEDLEEESRLKRYSEYLNNLQDSEDSDDEESKDVKRIKI